MYTLVSTEWSPSEVLRVFFCVLEINGNDRRMLVVKEFFEFILFGIYRNSFFSFLQLPNILYTTIWFIEEKNPT